MTRQTSPSPSPSHSELFAVELRERLQTLDYPAFDRVMRLVLERSGYAPVHGTDRKYKRGRTRSGGLDIRAYVHTDLSETLILVQIKQYRRVVSRRFVDELRGCTLRLGAESGLLLTTSTFSRVAQRASLCIGVAPIRLLDGAAIVDLLVQHRLGVQEDHRGRLRVDATFFDNMQEKSRSTGEASNPKAATSGAAIPKMATPKAKQRIPSRPLAPPMPASSPMSQPESIHPRFINRALGASGGDMQWRTHVLIGLNALWLFELIPNGVERGQLPLMLGAAAFGSLLPDLDAAQSKIKHLSAWGIKPFYLPSVAIYRTFGHRGFLHSSGALILVTLILVPLSTHLGWQVGAALVLGYGAHLAADACTRSGIPFLYLPPLSRNKRRYHLLPPRLRFVTGSDAEATLLPLVGLLLLLFLLRHLSLEGVTVPSGPQSTGKELIAEGPEFFGTRVP